MGFAKATSRGHPSSCTPIPNGTTRRISGGDCRTTFDGVIQTDSLSWGQLLSALQSTQTMMIVLGGGCVLAHPPVLIPHYRGTEGAKLPAIAGYGDQALCIVIRERSMFRPRYQHGLCGEVYHIILLRINLARRARRCRNSDSERYPNPTNSLRLDPLIVSPAYDDQPPSRFMLLESDSWPRHELVTDRV